MSFLEEIKRRKVIQVAAVYLVVAWLIMQVVDVVNEPLNLPDWFDTVVILFLGIGFPIAMILSWAFNITPEGVVRDRGSDKNGGRRIEYALLGLIVFSIAWLVYRVEISPSDEPAAVVLPSTPHVVEAASENDVLPNSVAVLPFKNLSPDPDNAYFAAGIHEELLNLLANISDLSVISRTSVVRYEGSNLSIPEIANELNVETVMEGSVRYAGNRVRIAAQLIDPETDDHLWSAVYERDLEEIFEVQAEIAENIAFALEAELLAPEQESIEQAPTDSLEAYAYYLRALVLFWDASEPSAPPSMLSDELSYLDRAIDLDSEFALAYARRAWVHLHLRGEEIAEEDWHRRRAELDEKIRTDAETALELDPSLGMAHAALGRLYWYTWRETEAEEAFEEALRLSPNNLDALIGYVYSMLGRNDLREKMLERAERAVQLDPNNGNARFGLGQQLRALGQYERASEEFRRNVELTPTNATPYVFLARSEVALGNLDSALEHLRLAEQLMPPETNTLLRAELVWGYGRLGQSEDAERIFRELEILSADRHIGPDVWAVAYLGLRDVDRAIEAFNSAVDDLSLVKMPFSFDMVTLNSFDDPLLERPEFEEVLKRLVARE